MTTARRLVIAAGAALAVGAALTGARLRAADLLQALHAGGQGGARGGAGLGRRLVRIGRGRWRRVLRLHAAIARRYRGPAAGLLQIATALIPAIAAVPGFALGTDRGTGACAVAAALPAAPSFADYAADQAARADKVPIVWVQHSDDDLPEVVGAVVLQPMGEAKAITQRRRQQPRARRTTRCRRR